MRLRLCRRSVSCPASLHRSRLALAFAAACVLAAVGWRLVSSPEPGVAGSPEQKPSSIVPPYLVAIVNASAPADDLFSGQFCGGIVVGSHSILTAAHCLDHRRPASIHVVVGAGNLCRGSSIDGRRMSVSRIASAPESSQRVDAAILTTRDSIGVTPAPLSPPRPPQIGLGLRQPSPVARPTGGAGPLRVVSPRAFRSRCSWLQFAPANVLSAEVPPLIGRSRPTCVLCLRRALRATRVQVIRAGHS